MVVLINYLHVMTILPSSILVNEIYVVPFRKDISMWFSRKFSSNTSDHEEEATESNNMSRLDRYLIHTYAPLVTRRSLYLIVVPIGMVCSVLSVFSNFCLKCSFISPDLDTHSA